MERDSNLKQRDPTLYKPVLLETSSAFGGQKKYLVQITGIGPINNPYNFKSDKGGPTLRNKDNNVIKQAPD